MRRFLASLVVLAVIAVPVAIFFTVAIFTYRFVRYLLS